MISLAFDHAAMMVASHLMIIICSRFSSSYIASYLRIGSVTNLLSNDS